MDSNVGLSAMVKGRSPSHGLRKALRRAGSTLVAGCLYVAHHFGPTRLLPADHPTRGNDFPPPTRSFLGTTTGLTELLQLAKISSLSRWASNWVGHTIDFDATLGFPGEGLGFGPILDFIAPACAIPELASILSNCYLTSLGSCALGRTPLAGTR